MHYLGQYLYLQSLAHTISITRFECKWYHCFLEYNWDPFSEVSNINGKTELGVVMLGTLTNMIVFSVLCIVMYVAQKTLGHISAHFSTLMLTLALGNICEPLLILLIDCIIHRWDDDSFKLFNYYEKVESNGINGIIMTLLIQTLLMSMSIILAYYYIIHLHKNGHILDIHSRLNSTELFYTHIIPNDYEISVRNLRWILIKAQRWIGLNGAKRKVLVTTYETNDKLKNRKDVIYHLAIYTQSLNGDMELYRHFLRNADGSIVEVFDALDLNGTEQYRKLEEKLLNAAAQFLDGGNNASNHNHPGLNHMRSSSIPFSTFGSTLSLGNIPLQEEQDGEEEGHPIHKRPLSLGLTMGGMGMGMMGMNRTNASGHFSPLPLTLSAQRNTAANNNSTVGPSSRATGNNSSVQPPPPPRVTLGPAALSGGASNTAATNVNTPGGLLGSPNTGSLGSTGSPALSKRSGAPSTFTFGQSSQLRPIGLGAIDEEKKAR